MEAEAQYKTIIMTFFNRVYERDRQFKGNESPVY
jgi:hypothetical protein